MKDRELIKLMWEIIKAILWHSQMPDDESLAIVLMEVHNRGIENAAYLEEVQ